MFKWSKLVDFPLLLIKKNLHKEFRELYNICFNYKKSKLKNNDKLLRTIHVLKIFNIQDIKEKKNEIWIPIQFLL